MKSLINTQVNFDCDEFSNYEIDKECESLTFCLKEFKVCLLFGFWFDLSIDIYFKHKGRPIIFSYANQNFEATYTFATLSDDSSVSQCTNVSSGTSRSSQLKNNKSFDTSNISEIMDHSLHGANIFSTRNESKIIKPTKYSLIIFMFFFLKLFDKTNFI